MNKAFGNSPVSFTYEEKDELEVKKTGNGAYIGLPKKWLKKYSKKKVWVFAGVLEVK